MKILFFSFVFLMSSQSFSQVVLTEESIDQFYSGNPTYEILSQRMKAAEVLKGSLTRSFMPKVLLSYGHERYTTGPYNNVNQPYGGIEAKVNVYNSGRDSVLNEQREKEARVASIDGIVTKVQVKAETLRSMSQLAYLIELRDILAQANELNAKNLKAAQTRISSGLATNTDTLDFKQQEISLNQQITSLNYEIGIVKRVISVLLGLQPETEINLQFVNSHPEHNRNFTFNPDYNNSLLVKKADLLSEISFLEKKQASKWWAPSADIYAYALRFTQKEREYPSPGQRNDTGIGFRITFPIFDGGEGYRVAQSKSATARSQEAMASYRRLEVQRDISNAKNKLELAHELIHGAEDNVAVMEDYRAGILNEYKRGIKNSPDVLQASQRWIQSKTQFAEVKKNYQFARADSMYLTNISKD